MVFEANRPMRKFDLAVSFSLDALPLAKIMVLSAFTRQPLVNVISVLVLVCQFEGPVTRSVLTR